VRFICSREKIGELVLFVGLNIGNKPQVIFSSFFIVESFSFFLVERLYLQRGGYLQ